MRNKIPISEILIRSVVRYNFLNEDDLVRYVLDSLERDFSLSDIPNYKYTVVRALNTLSDKGLVSLNKNNPTVSITLTGKGKQMLLKYNIKKDTNIVPMDLDCVYTFVSISFDTDQKSAKDKVRYILQKTNFLSINNNLFVTPFNLDSVIEELKTTYLENIIVIKSKNIDQNTKTIINEYFNIKV